MDNNLKLIARKERYLAYRIAKTEDNQERKNLIRAHQEMIEHLGDNYQFYQLGLCIGGLFEKIDSDS